jgi:hypothetical protein
MSWSAHKVEGLGLRAVRYDPTSKAESDLQIQEYPQTSLRSGELRRGRLRRFTQIRSTD